MPPFHAFCSPWQTQTVFSKGFYIHFGEDLGTKIKEQGIKDQWLSHLVNPIVYLQTDPENPIIL